MSKSISAGLGTHYGSETTTLATLWKVTRKDGRVFTFTGHDQNIEYPQGSPSYTYLAASGYTRTAISSNAGLAVDNLDLQTVFDSAGITEADLRAGLWDYATVEVMEVNWADLSQGHAHMRKGTMGEVTAGRLEFTAELRGLTQKLQQNVGRLVSVLCDAEFGDARCGIVLTGSPTSPWVKTGTITSVTSNRVFYDSARGEINNFFTFGKIAFTSGLNNGLSNEIKLHTLGSPSGAQFALQLAMPFTVAVGDAYTATAGCRKRFAEDCRDTYNNAANHRGFPHVPGTDHMSSGGL